MVTLRQALDESRREALSCLAEQLAEEIAQTTNARDRLSTIRAFLATVAQLEALDAAALRRTQASARSSLYGDSGAGSVVDDLLARRKARHDRRGA